MFWEALRKKGRKKVLKFLNEKERRGCQRGEGSRPQRGAASTPLLMTP